MQALIEEGAKYQPLLTASPSSPIADEILKTPRQPLSADVAEFRPMRPNNSSSAPKLVRRSRSSTPTLR